MIRPLNKTAKLGETPATNTPIIEKLKLVKKSFLVGNLLMSNPETGISINHCGKVVFRNKRIKSTKNQQDNEKCCLVGRTPSKNRGVLYMNCYQAFIKPFDRFTLPTIIPPKMKTTPSHCDILTYSAKMREDIKTATGSSE